MDVVEALALEEFPIVEPESYRRVGDLPKGGFGDVYIADDVNGRRVVIKELREDLIDSLGSRFAAEPAIVGKLDHANIVRVLQKGRWRSGRIFYAMELVRGRNLASEIDRKSLPARLDLLGVVHDVAGAIAYAHAQGVVHRDLKPANVIVGKKGIVIDWGLAGHVGACEELAADGEDRGLLTRAGAGTIYYASPEQLAGEPAHACMDVYSIGAILYELISGAPPYHDVPRDGHSDATAFYLAVAEREPSRIELTNVGANVAEVAKLAMACMARDPAIRPSMANVLGALAPWRTSTVCVRCGDRVERSTSQRLDVHRWMCSKCFLDRVGGSINDPLLKLDVSAPSVTDDSVASTGSKSVTQAQLALYNFRRGCVVYSHDDVTTTAAIDDLDRHVWILEGQAAQTIANALVAAASRATPLVYTSGLQGATPTVVIEEPLGESIDHLLRDGAVSQREASLLALIDVARCLERLHQAGFAHRAVKEDALVARWDGTGLITRWEHVRRAVAGDAQGDIDAYLSILRRVVASTSLQGDVEQAVAAFQKKRNFASLMRALEQAITEVKCQQCGCDVRASAAALTGKGYICAKCARSIAVTSGLDAQHVNLTERERKTLSRSWSLGTTIRVILFLLAFGAAESLVPEEHRDLVSTLVGLVGGPLVLMQSFGLSRSRKLLAARDKPTARLGGSDTKRRKTTVVAAVPAAGAGDGKATLTPATTFTNPRAASAAKQADLMLARAGSDESKRRERLRAVLCLVEAVQQSLFARLRRALLVDAQTASSWLATRRSENPKPNGSDRALDALLESGVMPELITVGAWLKHPPAPAELAAALDAALAIPADLRGWVFELGAVRNVIAHRAQYENQPDRDLGGARRVFVWQIVDGVRVLDIEPEVVEQLRERCRRILKGTTP